MRGGDHYLADLADDHVDLRRRGARHPLEIRGNPVLHVTSDLGERGAGGNAQMDLDRHGSVGLRHAHTVMTPDALLHERGDAVDFERCVRRVSCQHLGCDLWASRHLGECT